MVLGIYYLTQERPGAKGEGMAFKSVNEAILAYENGVVTLHSRVKVKVQKTMPDGTVKSGVIDSTVGRFIFNEIIPQDLGNADIKPTFHLYSVILDPEKAGGDVQLFKKKLAQKGVTEIAHFGPLYRFEVLKARGYDEAAIAASCPVTEEVFDRRFTHFPIYGLTQEQLDYMADAILESIEEMQKGI